MLHTTGVSTAAILSYVFGVGITAAMLSYVLRVGINAAAGTRRAF